MPSYPQRGEIWPADLSPTRGHEQAGERPVLIVSTNAFNRGPAELICVLPITRTDRRVPLHVRIDPPEGGLAAPGFVLCDAIRSIARERLGAQAWGAIGIQTMRQVEDRLRILLEL